LNLIQVHLSVNCPQQEPIIPDMPPHKPSEAASPLFQVIAAQIGAAATPLTSNLQWLESASPTDLWRASGDRWREVTNQAYTVHGAATALQAQCSAAYTTIGHVNARPQDPGLKNSMHRIPNLAHLLRTDSQYLAQAAGRLARMVEAPDFGHRQFGRNSLSEQREAVGEVLGYLEAVKHRREALQDYLLAFHPQSLEARERIDPEGGKAIREGTYHGGFERLEELVREASALV
jgi:hypothetical protein